MKLVLLKKVIWKLSETILEIS